MSSTQTTSNAQQNIIRYFEEAGMDYQTWSPSFNMHFGYLRRGKSPFQLEGMLNQMNREVMDRLQLDPEADNFALDLGCGLATTSRYMARLLPNTRFFGATITPWQIKFGRQLNEEAGLSDRIQLVETDYQDLPLPDNSANAAFALESACYARGNDKAELIQEAARVLKPGARFVIADGFRKHSRPLPGWLDRMYQRNLECWALKEYADINLFVQALKDTGFKNIVVEDIPWNVAPSFCYIPLTVIRFFGRRLWESSPTPLTRQRVNNILAPLYGMALGLSRRHFSYYIVSAEKG